MGDGKSQSPWEQAAPTPQTPQPPPPGDQTTVNPHKPRVPQMWGAAPVGVPRGAGGRLRPVAPAAPAETLQMGDQSFGPTELLRLRDRDRTNRVEGIQRAGWPGSRCVLVASLYGGAGVSTLTAQLAWAGRERGLPAVLLDASAAYGTGAAARIPETAQMTQRPSWADLARLTDTAGPATLSAAFSERLPSLTGTAPVLIGGRQPADGLRHRPSPTLLADTAAAARSGGWPLVAVDLGVGADILAATLGRFDPDLLVIVARADAAEIRESAAFLRALAGSGIRTGERTVLAIAHDGRISRPVSAARASVLDAAAGSIDAPFTEHLRNRTSTVTAAPPPISLLMALLAVSTPTHYQCSGRSAHHDH